MHLTHSLRRAWTSVAAGRIRVLAVSGTERARLTPDTPRLKELGLAGFEGTSWDGLFVPKGAPPAAVQRLSEMVLRLLKEPEIVAKYQGMGCEISAKTREQFVRQVRTDRDHWAPPSGVPTSRRSSSAMQGQHKAMRLPGPAPRSRA